jgi:hydrogenase expression/formation protein HypD
MKGTDHKQILEKLKTLAEKVTEKLGRPAVLMEVCGTHTTVIARSGIKSLFSGSLDLRSGPGCPVCVTDQTDIDRVIALSQYPNIVIATFGDMLKVPGTFSSLERERAKGAIVEVFYSPMDALTYAESHPSKKIVFLGVGFETTTPIIAATIVKARARGLKNYSVFSVHKVVPPAMRALLDDGTLRIDGFILPGHVSAIIGRKGFDFMASQYRMPSVIAGFEPTDVLGAICLLLDQILRDKVETTNGYSRLVTEAGNLKARDIVWEAFESAHALWRGFGLIPESGLVLRESYGDYDAMLKFPVNVPESRPPEGCSCGDILKGKLKPSECPLFGSPCSPFDPVGPCMVSSEGACAACYQYEWAQ